MCWSIDLCASSPGALQSNRTVSQDGAGLSTWGACKEVYNQRALSEVQSNQTEPCPGTTVVQSLCRRGRLPRSGARTGGVATGTHRHGVFQLEHLMHLARALLHLHVHVRGTPLKRGEEGAALRVWEPSEQFDRRHRSVRMNLKHVSPSGAHACASASGAVRRTTPCHGSLVCAEMETIPW